MPSRADCEEPPDVIARIVAAVEDFLAAVRAAVRRLLEFLWLSVPLTSEQQARALFLRLSRLWRGTDAERHYRLACGRAWWAEVLGDYRHQ